MYVPLRVSSPFSIGLGTMRAEELALFCRENNIPAVAMADSLTLAGGLTNSKVLRAAGVQSIAGVVLKIVEPRSKAISSFLRAARLVRPPSWRC